MAVTQKSPEPRNGFAQTNVQQTRDELEDRNDSICDDMSSDLSRLLDPDELREMPGKLVENEIDWSARPLPPLPQKRPTIPACEMMPPLQIANVHTKTLNPIGEDGLDPASFDLVEPASAAVDGEPDRLAEAGRAFLESRSELLFSGRHMQAILDDPTQLHRFSAFLASHRPDSTPLLSYYLETIKALRALQYSNSVVQRLAPLADHVFTHHEGLQAPPTVNEFLQAKADEAFRALTRDELPMFITHVWVQTVASSVRHRIMDTLPYDTEGLAEVFCLSDPARPDQPLIFASEEFNKTTQYGLDYIVGRNCRFLQGPHTNPDSVMRIREKIEAGLEHHETILNYRRDGTPFMNLLMIAPLYDHRGVIRYFLGTQVDVSNLAKECYGLEALKKLVDAESNQQTASQALTTDLSDDDGFTRLAELFHMRELDICRRQGGAMHRPRTRTATEDELQDQKRIVLRDSDSEKSSPPRMVKNGTMSKGKRTPSPTSIATPSLKSAAVPRIPGGALGGVYENYLLVRPHPSLRILFVSPSMRVPGILQSSLFDRIGGSDHMREGLLEAFAQGRKVTAKVRWLSSRAMHSPWKPKKRRDDSLQKNYHPLEAQLEHGDMGEDQAGVLPGRTRWLHCSPLLAVNKRPGVWMVVVVDEKDTALHTTNDAAAAMETRGRPNGPAMARQRLDANVADPTADQRTEQPSRQMHHVRLYDAVAAGATQMPAPTLTSALQSHPQPYGYNTHGVPEQAAVTNHSLRGASRTLLHKPRSQTDLSAAGPPSVSFDRHVPRRMGFSAGLFNLAALSQVREKRLHSAHHSPSMNGADVPLNSSTAPKEQQNQSRSSSLSTAASDGWRQGREQGQGQKEYVCTPAPATIREESEWNRKRDNNCSRVMISAGAGAKAASIRNAMGADNASLKSRADTIMTVRLDDP